MKISKNFALEELTKSQTAEALKIDNTPEAEQIVNLCALVYNVLQPLRDHYGQPVKISSGYRCQALNKAVGGVTNSQHMRGQAADIKILGVTPTHIADYIANHLPYDQVILYPTFVHVSYSIQANRRHRLRGGGGK